ncbi:hypothetical protein P691DRAFT_799460 [Macrolepiota fuliginosa MF-IS2]|uniref:Uncharacterized protein n=1 Tax=Macrolepiota fuliginosa MF-IS2 TaxID=1400762 RepID=A0A9P6BX92_9AGAR|nr:hypothetical protein P691DRAFT_799460 [Macrolepiota fuliginosa MF-IS2]
MKQLAAHDFEDLLQVSLLVEPHNQLLLDLLFSLSCWHALAKLHLQTMSTIKFLQKLTQALGYYLQKFARITCTVYDAHELVQELNFYTYKLHSLGDYPSAIQQYGTYDGFSTQVMSY